MSYSLREVLILTKRETDSGDFAPYLLDVFMNLVEEMADLCQQNKVDISTLSPFELKTNDWHIALLQIYENLYLSDCQKYKNSPEYSVGKRGLPNKRETFSSVIFEHLYNLHERRVTYPMSEKQKREITNPEDFNYIQTRLKVAQERVHNQVFGPQTPPPAPSLKQTDADIRREQELKEAAEAERRRKLLEQVASQIKEPQASEQKDYKLRFSSVGYEVLTDEQKPVKSGATKQKQKVYSQNKWPYYDSYIPQAKMLEKDARLIKGSLMQEHFTSPVSDKHFQLSELERRQQTLKLIERKFVDSMAEKKHTTLDKPDRHALSVNPTLAKMSQMQQQQMARVQIQQKAQRKDSFKKQKGTKPISFPLVVGDDYLENLLREMTNDAIGGSNAGGDNHSSPSRMHKGDHNSSMSIRENNLGDDLQGRSIHSAHSGISGQSKSQRPVRVKEESELVYQKLLDPEQLLDYNPVDGGLRVGLAGLAGLPLGDTAVYSIEASIDEHTFKWDCAPHLTLSVDGNYIFQDPNQTFNVINHKANEGTCVLYTVSRYDLKTKQKVDNYAFGVQPLIHILSKRQFLICGLYNVPLYTGAAPPQLLQQLQNKPRQTLLKMLKAHELKPLQHCQLVTRVGDLDKEVQVAFNQDWWPQSQTSMHHFGAIGPDALAQYQQAFLAVNRAKRFKDKLAIIGLDALPSGIY